MLYRNKDIKLLICDIDETLTGKGGDLFPLGIEALNYFHSKGVLLGLATGRPIDKRTINKFKTWGLNYDVDVLIGLNGCETYIAKTKTKKIVAKIDKEEMKRIIDFMWPLNINAIVFENGYDRVYARRMNWMLEDSIKRNNSNVEIVDKERFYEKDFCKIEFPCENDEQIKLVEEAISKNPSDKSEVIISYKGTYEFMPVGVSKGTALEKLCEELNISLDNVMACGDMDNDALMLEKAGIGVCLKNGSDFAKSKADYVTKYNVSEDGLGRFLMEEIHLN